MAPDHITDEALQLTYRQMSTTLLEKSARTFQKEQRGAAEGSEIARFCGRRLTFIAAELERRGVSMPIVPHLF